MFSKRGCIFTFSACVYLLIAVWRLIFLFSLFTYRLSAQSTVHPEATDSLKITLQKIIEVAQKVKVLGELAYTLAPTKPIEAQKYAEQALTLAQQIQNTEGIATAYTCLGRIYQVQSDYKLALAYYLKSLKIREKQKDDSKTAFLLNSIGLIYRLQSNLDKALQYHQEAEKIALKNKDAKGLALSYNNIGNVYFSRKDFQTALYYHQKALKLRQDVGEAEGLVASYNNVGIMLARLQRYQEAMDYYNQAVNVNLTQLHDNTMLAATYDNMGDIYLKMSQFTQAYDFIQKGLETAQSIQSKHRIMESYQSLVEFYTVQEDYKSALQFQQKYTLLKDSVFNEQNTRTIANLQQAYQIEKQQIQIDLLHKERQLQRVFIAFFVGIAILAILISIYLYQMNKRKQRVNNLLSRQRKEIAEKNQQLKAHSIQIENSIQVAKTIQESILPSSHRIDEILGEYFVLFRPKDVVSGDFYWAHSIENQIFLAVADCTGHGVPGALMAMLGSALLDKIVIAQNITQPIEILNKLHLEIQIALKQQETYNNSGMDIAFIILEKQIDETTLVRFAGAKRPLFYLKAGENQFEILKGDRKSIGGEQNDKKYFTEQQIIFPPNSLIYLTTDGFTDQPNVHRKRFGELRFAQLVYQSRQLSLAEQCQVLEKSLNVYMQSESQRDDMLLIGLRV
jgi:serine phosphatase RsbU (regulator of sigma subunit)